MSYFLKSLIDTTLFNEVIRPALSLQTHANVTGACIVYTWMYESPEFKLNFKYALVKELFLLKFEVILVKSSKSWSSGVDGRILGRDTWPVTT